MEAAAGDRLHVHGNVVGHPERTGGIVEVAERADSRPTWCVSTTVTRAWCSPARDAIIERPRRKVKKGSAKG